MEFWQRKAKAAPSAQLIVESDMNTKKIFNWKSKTHWFAAALFILGLALAILPEVEHLIDPAWYAPAIAIIGILVGALRSVTKTAIDQK